MIKTAIWSHNSDRGKTRYRAIIKTEAKQVTELQIKPKQSKIRSHNSDQSKARDGATIQTEAKVNDSSRHSLLYSREQVSGHPLTNITVHISRHHTHGQVPPALYTQMSDVKKHTFVIFEMYYAPPHTWPNTHCLAVCKCLRTVETRIFSLKRVLCHHMAKSPLARSLGT